MKNANTPPAAIILPPRLVGTSRFRLDPLEPRVLLSATTLGVLVDALANNAVVSGHITQDLALSTQPPASGAADAATQAQAVSTAQALPVGATPVLDVGASMQQLNDATVGVLTGVTVDGSVSASVANSSVIPGVAVAFDEAWSKVLQVLKHQPVESWFGFFPGADSAPNANWLERATAAVNLIESGQLPWTQVAVSGSVLGQAYAAFAVQGESGAPSILVNLDRIQTLTSQTDLVTALVEEIGHGIDYLVNGAHDSPGDEGELFAAHVMGVVLSTEVRTQILAEDDSTQIQWLGRSVRVEQALSINTDSSATSPTFLADTPLTVTGARVVTASGNMQVGQDSLSTLNGDGVGSADSLTLKSDANVKIWSQIGDTNPLSGLTVTGLSLSTSPTSVTFKSDVKLGGDLTINCTGTVIFEGKLTLTSGNLKITGASQIIFGDQVSLAGGDITLEGNKIDFGAYASIQSDGGILTLRPANPALSIRVADPYTQVVNALDLNYGNSGILSKVAQHQFSKIIIGYIDTDGHALSTAGTVYIGANTTATQSTFASPLEVYGGSIQVDDLQGNTGLGGASFVVYGDLKFDAYLNIKLYNAVEAKTISGFTETLRPVTLYAKTGYIAQLNQADNLGGDGVSNEPLRGSTLTATAVTGISLIATEFDTVTLLNSGATGGITLQETATGAALTVLSAQLSNAANTSNIDISTLGGVLTVASTGSGGSGVTTASTTTGNITLRAKTNLVLNQSVTAPGTIKLVAVDGSVSQAASQSLSATRLLIQAATGAGTTTQALQASVQQLRGLVTTSGGLFVDAQGGVVLDAMVTGDAVSESWDLLGTNFALNVMGNLALHVLNGTLNVNSTIQALAVSGVAAQAGNVRLQTSKTVAASSVLTVNAALSAQGHVTLLSDSDVVLTATGDVSLTTAGKNLDIEATLGAVTMQISGTDEAVIQTNAGNVRLSAVTAAKNVTLAQVDARSSADRATPALTGQASWGSVSVIAGGSVLDADTTGATDVYAANLRINAGAAVGALGGTPNVLEVEVQKLSAVASAGVVGVADASALEVGSVAAFSWSRVQADGSVLAGTSDVLQAGVSAANGSVVLTAAGALSVTQAITLTGTPSSTVGNVLLQGADTGVSLSAGVTTAGGAVSVLASAGDLVLASTGDITVFGAGTVDVQAATGAVTMQVSGTDKAVIQTNAGNVRVSAATAAKNVTMGLIDSRSTTGRSGTGDADQANWGSVSVVAGGSVLDADTTAVDVYAKNLRLNAGAGIGVLGATPNVLEVEVQTLSVAAAAGGVGLADATALEIGTPASVAWSSVQATGATSVGTADLSQSGITAASGSVVVTAGAALSVTQAVALTGTPSGTVGNVLLQGAGTGVSLSAGLTTAGGSVSVIATAGSVTLAAAGDITVSGSGTVDVQAAQAVTMTNAGGAGTNNESVITTSGNVSIKATVGDVTLGQISTPTGKVAVQAGGALVDGDTLVDVTALGLYVSTGAAGAVGSGSDVLETSVDTFSLTAGSGGAFVSESAGLDTGNVSVVANRVGAGGVTQAQTAVATSGAGVQSTGALVVQVLSGDLAVKDGSTAAGITATGHVLLSAAGAVGVQSTLTSAGSVSVVATAGDVTLAAAGDITLSTATKTVDIEATAGAVVMQVSGSNKAVIQTNAGNVRLSAATAAKSVSMGLVDARSDADRTASALTGQANWGSVSVIAGAAVLDADTGATDVYAASLRIHAGTGVGVLGATPNALEIEVQKLSAVSVAGALGVTDVSGLDVGTASAVTLSRVKTDGTLDTAMTDAAQLGVSTANGSVVLTAAGALSVTQAVALTGTGNLLLQGAGTGVSVTAALGTVTGSVSVVATAGDVVLGSAGDITVATGGTVDVQATAGAVTMQFSGADKAVIQTNAGNVRVSAAAATKNVTLGLIDARSNADRTASALTGQASWGAVSVIAGGSVLDADTNAAIDVYAASLRLNAGAGVGVLGGSVNGLEIEVQKLSAVASGGVVGVADASALEVGTAAAVSLSRVKSDGTLDTAMTDAAQSGLSAANGSVVVTAVGALSVTQAVALTGTSSVGNVLLQGADTGVSLSASLTTAGGAVSVVATAGDVVLASTGDITTTGAGTVDVQATAGAVTMQLSVADKAVIQTNAGNVRVSAAAATKNVTLGLIDARSNADRTASALTGQASWGAVSVIAGGSVLDADTNAAIDVYAASLRLNAGAGVGVLGGSVNGLEIEVQKLSAVASGGVVGVADASALEVGTAAAVSLSRVKSDGTLDTAMTDAAQSGLSAANGSVVVTAVGALSVTQAVALTGTSSVGNLLLQGAGAGVSVSAGVSTAGGGVSLVATAGDVTLGATGDITVAGAGTVDVESSAGVVTMQTSGADKNVIQTNGGKVRLSAATTGKNLSLGLIDTRVSADRTASSLTSQGLWGSVSLIAGGTVSDTDTSGAPAVYALSLRINAGTGIGSLSSSVNPIDLETLLLSAVSASGAVAVSDASALALDSVSLSINRVTNTGALSASAISDATQGGASTSNASLVVVANQKLELNQALSVSGASGSVLLKSVSAGVKLSAASTVAAGSMSVVASGDVEFTPTGDISLALAGQTVDVESTTGAVIMASTPSDKTVLKTNAGNVRVSAATAGKDLTLGLVDARSAADRAASALTGQSSWGSVSLISGGSVLDTSTEGATGSAPIDVYAASLRVNAGAAVGVLGSTPINPNVLELEVQKFSAVARAGGVGVKAINAIEVGTTAAVAVSRVQADGTQAAATTDTAQSGVSAVNGSVVITSGAALTVNQAIGLTGTTSLGNLLLQSASTGVALNAALTTVGGAVSVAASAGDVVLAATGDITTVGSGTVDVIATTGEINMQVSASDKAVIQTNAANVRLITSAAAKNVTLGLVDTRSAADRTAVALTGQASWGSVSVTAGGSVLDGDSNAATDVYAAGLRLTAGAGVGVLGSTANPLESEVLKMSATTADGVLALADASALEVGTTVAVSLNRVQASGALATTPTTDAAQSGVSAANGSVVITAAGALSVTQAVTLTGSTTVGNLLLQGTADTLTAALSTAGGSVGLLATAGDVTMGSAGDITVTGSGSVDVQAAQALSMTSAGVAGTTNESVISTTGNVSLKALAGNVSLGQVSSGGQVAIVAGGSVVDGDSAVDVTALDLYLSTGSTGGVGTSSDALDTSVDRLAMSAGTGGVYLKESTGVTLDNVSVVVYRVNSSGVAQAQTALAASTVSTTSVMGLEVGGDLLATDASHSLQATSLVVKAAGSVGSGTQAVSTQVAQLAVQAGGSVFLSEADGLQISALNLGGAYQVQGLQAGDAVALQAGTLASHDLQVNAPVQATGNVRLGAAGALSLQAALTSGGSASLLANGGSMAFGSAANVTLTGSGTLDVQAAQNLVMANTVSTGGNVSLAATSGDVTLGQVTSTALVAVVAGGSVIDGDTALDVTASGLSLTTGASGAVGSSTDPLETSLDTLSLSAGSGGAFVTETSGLTVDTVSVVVNRVPMSGSAVAQTALGSAVGQLVASGGGGVSVRLSAGDLLFKAGSQVQTTGSGGISLTSDQGSVVQEKGSVVSSQAGAVQVQAQNKAQMTNVSTVSGDVGVSSTQGAFEVPAVAPGEVVDYGGKPVRVKSTDVQISAPVVSAGSSFEITLPSQTSNLDTITSSNFVKVATVAPVDPTRAFVVGDVLPGSNAPTTDVVRVDRSEVGFIGSTDPTKQLKDIMVGSQSPGQAIWLQSDSTTHGALVFNAPLVLVASGLLVVPGQPVASSSVKVVGDIQGKGLTIYGSGSTVTYDGANVQESGDIMIYDSVVVNQDTTLTAVGGNIAIQGRITVKPGVTLTLVGSHVTLGSGVYNGVTRSGVDNSGTLKITADDLSLDAGVTLDGGTVGQLVLQGGLLSSAKAAQLTALASAMVNNSFAALSLGDSATALTLGNDSLLNEGVTTLTLLGTQVSLDDVVTGTANWTTNSTSLKLQASGTGVGARDVLVDVKLVSATNTDMALSSAAGNVTMTAAAKLAAVGGNLTLHAAGDVVVGEINASTTTAASVGGVALDSSSGTIRAASSTTGLVGAKTVSIFGNGPNVSDLATQTAVKVQAQQMQVSAPSGSVVRDSGASGETYYTLIKRGTYYRQATVVGTAPSHVVVAKAQVSGTPENALLKAVAGYSQYVALRNAGLLSTTVTLSGVSSSNTLGGLMQVSVSAPPPSFSSASSVSAATPFASSLALLSDLSYGLGSTSGLVDVQINSAVNWATGLPVADSKLQVQVVAI